MTRRHFDILIEDLSEAYVEEVAALHVAVFPDSVAAALGPKVVAADFRRRCLGAAKEFSCRVALLKSDRRLAGYCLHAPVDPHGHAATLLDGDAVRSAVKRRLWTSPRLWRYLLLWAFRKAFRPGAVERYAPDSGLVASHNVVVPEFRGSNVGRDLMIDVEHIARRRGVRRICGYVHRDNIKAEKLYFSLGWVRTNPRRDDVLVFAVHRDVAPGPDG